MKDYLHRGAAIHLTTWGRLDGFGIAIEGHRKTVSLNVYTEAGQLLSSSNLALLTLVAGQDECEDVRLRGVHARPDEEARFTLAKS